MSLVGFQRISIENGEERAYHLFLMPRMGLLCLKDPFLIDNESNEPDKVTSTNNGKANKIEVWKRL